MRRRRTPAALGLWAVLTGTAPALVRADQAAVVAPIVEVNDHKGLYTVAARFTVAQPPAVALAVLSDYEAIPRLVPDVRRSVVVQREPQLLVAQDAVSQFGLFSRTIHLLLEVAVSPDAITFVDRSGKSFSTYHGRWAVLPQPEGSVVTYELTARPAFGVPGFVVRRLMTRDAREMIVRLAAAMAARQP